MLSYLTELLPCNVFSSFGTTRVEEEHKVLLLGLDASGKTSLLYRLLGQEGVATIPTIGFNVETYRHKNTTLQLFDAAWSSKNIRGYIHHYLPQTRGVVVVVDSADIARIPAVWREEEGQERFHLLDSVQGMFAYFLQHQPDIPEGVPVLVLLNKQDLPQSLSVPQLTQELELQQHREKHPILVQPCSVVTGEGLDAGFDWLVDSIAQ